VIEVGERRIRMLNTHLDTQRESRSAQLAALVAAVGAGSQPAILLGDFNAEPDAEEMAPLFALLTDAWRSAGQRAGHTYPAAVDAAPDRRIDYIFTSREGVRVIYAEVVVSGVRCGAVMPRRRAAARPPTAAARREGPA
jgi:endonuclease/exonuclease/phosphatase family metal-dependent hydrolase